MLKIYLIFSCFLLLWLVGTVLLDSCFQLLSSSYKDRLECIVIEEEYVFPFLGSYWTWSGEEKYPETALWQAKELQQGAGRTSSTEENKKLQWELGNRQLILRRDWKSFLNVGGVGLFYFLFFFFGVGRIREYLFKAWPLSLNNKFTVKLLTVIKACLCFSQLPSR